MSTSCPITKMKTPTSPSLSMSKVPTEMGSSPTQPPSTAELPTPWTGNNITHSPSSTFPPSFPSSTPIPTWAPFSIVTATDSLTSNFPYTSRLREHLITPDQWLQFTSEIIASAKLTFVEDAAAWTAGISTGTLASPFLLVFGPVAGYYAGKSVHRKAVAKKVRERLATETPLRDTLRQWNEGVFREKGVQMWLEPPTTSGEVIVDAPARASEAQIQKLAKKQGKRFRFIVMPYDPRNKVIGSDHNPNAGSWSQSGSPVSPGARLDEDGKERERWDGVPVEVSGVREVAEVDGKTVQRKKSGKVFLAELAGSEPIVVKLGK